MKRPSLIPEWRRAWRFLTVQIAAAAVVWGTLPVDTQTAMLAAVGVPLERVPAILGAVILFVRLISQTPQGQGVGDGPEDGK